MKNFILIFFTCILLGFSESYSQKLTVWHTENDPMTLAAFDTIARSFEKINEGVEVNIVAVGWQDLYRRLALAVESGESPDITQIQPFMAAHLVGNGFLSPIDNLVKELDKNEIFESVKKLQYFDEHYYGIATALGISYYAYRYDKLPQLKEEYPRTWSELVDFAKNNKSDSISPILLPSNDLHVTLLFTELLASNSGSLFDKNNMPNFSNKKVIETLAFWKELYQTIPNDYRHNGYSDNFTSFARGQSILMPNFFGRGLMSIERVGNKNETNPEHYKLFPHIVNTESNTGYATLDAEAWTIPTNAKNKELAEKFLEFFYSDEMYLVYCNSVPIHLTPIFEDLAENEYKEGAFVKKWEDFYNYQIGMLQQNRVLPIFMSSPEHKNIKALFQLEGTGVIANMVRNVTENNMTPENAAAIAMEKAEELMPQNTEFSNNVTPKDLIIYLLLFIVVIALITFAIKRFK